MEGFVVMYTDGTTREVVSLSPQVTYQNVSRRKHTNKRERMTLAQERCEERTQTIQVAIAYYKSTKELDYDSV